MRICAFGRRYHHLQLFGSRSFQLFGFAQAIVLIQAQLLLRLFIADLVCFNSQLIVQCCDEHGDLSRFCKSFHVGCVLGSRGNSEVQARFVLRQIGLEFDQIAIDPVCQNAGLMTFYPW